MPDWLGSLLLAAVTYVPPIILIHFIVWGAAIGIFGNSAMPAVVVADFLGTWGLLYFAVKYAGEHRGN